MSEVIRLDQLLLKKLLVSDRLDLIIKYLYIESYIENKDYNYYLDLYKRHIAFRTGGFEDDKKSINDYVERFNNLIESIRVNGFDKHFPIPVSKQNGIILNGAHRLACCLYFGKDAYVEYFDKVGLSWNYDWLNKNGFQEDLDHIFNKYVEIKSENTIMAILWGPIKEYWDKVAKIISRNHKIVGRRDYYFNKSGFSSVVEDIYSYEFGIYHSANIKNKINFLMRHSLSFSVVIFNVEEPEYIIEKDKKICKQALELKKIIREKMKSVVDINKFATMHTSDNPEHNVYLSNILFNKHNLENLKVRKTVEYRKEFLDWLNEYTEVIKKYDLRKEECCIVGSSTLEVLGIRKSTDIDFIVCSHKRSKYFPDEFMMLSENVDVVYKGYHKRSKAKKTYTDDQVIYDKDKHFYFRGLKFASVNIIRDRKDHQRRPKDLKDVMLIDEFFNYNTAKSFKNAIERIKHKTVMSFQIYVIAYFKHGILNKIKRKLAMSMTEKQKVIVKKFLRR